MLLVQSVSGFDDYLSNDFSYFRADMTEASPPFPFPFPISHPLSIN